MILLDTDHLSVLAYPESRQGELLFARLVASPDQSFAFTIISAEEQMRGWLAEVRRSRDTGRLVRAYERLLQLIDFWKQWRILPFDDRAAAQFESLRRQRVRVGSQDLRIAAVALVNGTQLLSANLRDFEQVPNLTVENWLV
jgi:tRNA(fMet)-specific endonuclease VapC